MYIVIAMSSEVHLGVSLVRGRPQSTTDPGPTAKGHLGSVHRQVQQYSPTNELPTDRPQERPVFTANKKGGHHVVCTGRQTVSTYRRNVRYVCTIYLSTTATAAGVVTIYATLHQLTWRYGHRKIPNSRHFLSSLATDTFRSLATD